MALVTLDLDSNTLVYGSGMTTPITALRLPRGSGTELRVRCVRAGMAESLPEGFGLVWTCKELADWSGPEIAYADEFVETPADSGVYVAPVNYETEALDTLLGVGDDGELGSVIISAQLAWRADTDEPWQSTQVIDLTLHNSIWRDGAMPPVISSDFDVVSGGTLTIKSGATIIAEPGALVLGFGGSELTVLESGILLEYDVTVEVFSFEVVADATYELELQFLWYVADSSSHSTYMTGTLPSGTVAHGFWARYSRSQPAASAQFGFATGATVFSASGVGDTSYQNGHKFLIKTGETAGTVMIEGTSTAEGISTPLTAGTWAKLTRLV